jgi:hypothetical protein
MTKEPVSEQPYKERRQSCGKLIDEKLAGIRKDIRSMRNQIATGFAVATAIIVLTQYLLQVVK